MKLNEEVESKDEKIPILLQILGWGTKITWENWIWDQKGPFLHTFNMISDNSFLTTENWKSDKTQRRI